MMVSSSSLSLPQAVTCMTRGGVVIYPTETYFAVGCAVTEAAAVARVYQVKDRAVHKPLPVIAAHWQQIEAIAKVPASAESLCARFWPGPLSVLLPALPCVPPLVTGGTGLVAVRVSPHPLAMSLARRVGQALVASSANISGHCPVTAACALEPRLVARVDGVVDSDVAPGGGQPSTLVQVIGDRQLRVLRDGAVSRAALRQAGYRVE